MTDTPKMSPWVPILGILTAALAVVSWAMNAPGAPKKGVES